MMGITPDELTQLDLPCPTGFEYIWEWFLRLNATRSQGGLGGVSGISEQEIKAFFENRRIVPDVWEIELMVALDRVALSTSNEDKTAES